MERRKILNIILDVTHLKEINQQEIDELNLIKDKINEQNQSKWNVKMRIKKETRKTLQNLSEKIRELL